MLFQKFAFQPTIKSASAFLYFQRKGIAQKMLHELKYKGKKDLGILLGNWFASSIYSDNIDVVVPVPLHRSKFRRRTYNQSEQIAKGIAEVLGLELRTDLVRREVATESQTSKSKAQRWMNIENIYSNCRVDLSGRSVLVVDDVVTTGATVGMLCERLVEANAREIHVAALARGK